LLKVGKKYQATQSRNSESVRPAVVITVGRLTGSACKDHEFHYIVTSDCDLTTTTLAMFSVT